MNEVNMEELRLWLRENAKNVKTFEVDSVFTKQITCYEGEQREQKVFKSLEELKDYYGRKGTSTGEGIIEGARGLVKEVVRTVKDSLAGKKRES